MNRTLFHITTKLFACLIINCNLEAQGKDTSSVIFPNWAIFQGDSIVGESNGECRTNFRPEVVINLDKNKELTIIFRTFSLPSSESKIIRTSICFNNEKITSVVRYGYYKVAADYYENTFTFKNSDLQNKLKNHKDKKLTITFQDESYQKKPITLGFLVIR